MVYSWTYSDCTGNEHTWSHNVTVYDNIAPEIIVPVASLIMDCFDAAAVDTWAAAATATDNCDANVSVTHSYTIPAAGCDQVITVTFSATDVCGNTGTATATFTVDDQTAPSITCPSDQIRDLSPNATHYTVNGTEFDYESATDNCGTVIVTNNLNGTNSLDNYVFEIGETQVTWTAIDECGNESRCTFNVFIYSTSFRITKTAVEDSFDQVGDIIHYTISVDNTGNVSVSTIAVTDPGADPGSIVYVSGDTDGDLILDHNENWTFSATHTITQTDIDAGHYENTVVVTGTPASGTLDPAGDSEDVPAVQLPAISTDKTLVSYSDNDGSGSISVNDVLTYSVIVTNTGNTTLHNVTITDPLLSPISTSCVSLIPGATCILTGTYTVTQANVDAGEIVNTGTGDSDETDPTEDTEIVTINRVPAITVDKSVDLSTISAPGTLTYTIVVVNTGNTSLTNVVLTDAFAGGATLTSGDDGDGVLEVGETWTYTADYTVTQADIDAGADLVNVAVVDTDQTEPVNDDATTSITRTSSLTITKSVDLSTISAPGTLTYTISSCQYR